MKKLAVVAQVLVFLFIAQASRAAEIYVSPDGAGDGGIGSPTNLQMALDTARTNAESDTIYLSAGVYDASAAGANTFDFDAGLASSDGLPVTISGGWDDGFISRSDDPLATALSGGVSARVLHIKADAAGAVADITLEMVGIVDGKTTAATSPLHGAGILATQSLGGAVTLTVDRCVFHGNIAEMNSGGAIASQGPITVTDTRFTYNRADTGGAVYLWATSTPALFTGCDFSDNSIGNTDLSRPNGWQGSTIFSNSPDLTVDDCDFRGMTDGSTSGAGSTIYVGVSGYLTARNTSFRDISILYWGSAIQLWDAAASISGCLFAGNRAGTSSGYAAVTYLDNTGGPGPQTTSIVNSTFVGNTTGSDYAGDIHFRGGTLTIRNSIFFDNTTSPGIKCETGCVGSIDYSSVEGGAGSASGMTYGANNTTAAPLFVAGDDDYHLQQTSPCVDAGTNAAAPADPLATDFDGDPRIFAVIAPASPVVDMGWDEYCNTTLEFTAPPSGTSWLNDGTARSITWVCQNIGGDVKLYLWQGPRFGGAPVAGGDIATVPCSDQAVTWTPPEVLPDATDYVIAMDSLLYPTLGHGIGPLALQHLHLTRPNSGKWTQGSTYAIKWESSGLAGAKVRIDLYGGDQRAGTIAKKAPNTGSFSWRVPFTQAPGNAFRVKVSTTSPLAAADFSDANLSILPAVALTAPNGGQIWKRGTTQTIAWSYKNAPGTAVRLELYKDGVFNRLIAASVPIGAAGAGSYPWTIPANQAAAKTYTVKVSSVDWPKVFDFSNSVFTIKK